MDRLNDLLTEVSGLLWGWPMMILLLGTHVYLTVVLRFPQRKILTAIRLSVRRDPGATGDVSQFGSLATALAATIGTGNIIGVATAIALGGPYPISFWGRYKLSPYNWRRLWQRLMCWHSITSSGPLLSPNIKSH